MDSLVGRALGPYELEVRLGGGGMGTVYRAMHQALQQPRAIKVLRHDLASDSDVVERFRREAMIAARLRHQNIVLVYDVAEDDDIHYIVMDLLEGVSLRDLIRSATPLPLDRAVALLRQLASALDYAHGHGIIHRDVKPGNVMVAPDDHVTLVDFGIARAAEASRLTRSGMVVGTAEYMAPETFTGREGSGQSADLYALGIVAYEVMTGQLPFTGNPTAVSYAQVHNPLPSVKTRRPDLPPSVDEALQRQTAKQPADRFPTATAFVDALAPAGRSDRPTVFDASNAPTPHPANLPPRPPANPTAAPQPPRPTPEPGTMYAASVPLSPSPSQAPPPPSHAPSHAPTPAHAPQPGQPLRQPGYVPPPSRQLESRSSARGLTGYVLAVLVLVIGGTFAFCRDSFNLPGLSTNAPTPTVVAARPTTAPVTAPQATAPAAPTSAPAPPTAPTTAPAAGAVAGPAPSTTAPPPTTVPASPPTTVPASPPAAAASSPSPAPGQDFQPVFEERFANNQRGWPDNRDSTAWIEGGLYHLFARVEKQFVSVGAPGSGPFRDVEVMGRFRKVGGPPGGGFGLIVRDQGPPPRDGLNQGGRYYVLEAGEGRQYGIWRREQDRWVDLIVFTPSEAVRPPGETNELVARAIGPRLIFLINGTQVADIEDGVLGQGNVGIYVAGDGNMVDTEIFSVRAPR